jgi:flavin reductase (DIM6/NTAB) family NADH-FMN oxidoreductase RutF
MGRLFYSIQEIVDRPLFPGNYDPTHFYFHFQPARPADLLITRDRVSGDLNMSGGTIGPLTDWPYTICLHIAKRSFDSNRNIKLIGAECVVALPGKDIVKETWISALPLPRGIFEAEVAGLTLLPSKVVSVPGIAECPVNLECRGEFLKDWFTHDVVFLRVLGASLDEEYVKLNRMEIVNFFPTYEVDDQTNPFGGAIERLGVNGELLECPGFPVGPKRSYRAGPVDWCNDLAEAGYISDSEKMKLISWLGDCKKVIDTPVKPNDVTDCQQISRAFELIAWEEWQALHELLKNKLDN